MIRRTAQDTLERLAASFPVVTITGPRQSGKTTLCRMTFPDLPYVSLEAPDRRAYAREDPRGFLRSVAGGAILDEVQRAPELTSYLQGVVDEDPTPGRFILTGSRNFSVIEAISQSLAGRTGLLELLPFELEELQRFPDTAPDLFQALLWGGYPALFDRRPDREDWLGSYVTTYVERDVRQILNVGNLLAFQAFLGLSAGRCGQLLNLSGLGADAGVDAKTARAWLSVLEAGYITWRLPPWSGNVNKRLVKTPKLYFSDTGVLCHLLGIRSAEQLRVHPLRGQVFENWVLVELRKRVLNAGRRPVHFFYRDRKGLEVDLVARDGRGWLAVEIKSGETIGRDFFRGLDGLDAVPGFPELRRALVFGGDQRQERSRTLVVPWRETAMLLDPHGV